MLVTRQSLANGVLGRWRSQYPPGYESKFNNLDPTGIEDDLSRLGSSPDPDNVDKVIGNGSWTRVTCDICEEAVDAAIVLGPDFSETSVQVCESCLRKELEKFDALHS